MKRGYCKHCKTVYKGHFNFIKCPKDKKPLYKLINQMVEMHYYQYISKNSWGYIKYEIDIRQRI